MRNFVDSNNRFQKGTLQSICIKINNKICHFIKKTIVLFRKTIVVWENSLWGENVLETIGTEGMRFRCTENTWHFFCFHWNIGKKASFCCIRFNFFFFKEILENNLEKSPDFSTFWNVVLCCHVSSAKKLIFILRAAHVYCLKKSNFKTRFSSNFLNCSIFSYYLRVYVTFLFSDMRMLIFVIHFWQKHLFNILKCAARVRATHFFPYFLHTFFEE